MLEEHPIKSVRPDPRGRIGLGRDVIGDTELFKVFKIDDGDIILRPYVEIPEKEMWLLNNKKAMGEIKESFEQAKKGKVSKLDLSILEDDD